MSNISYNNSMNFFIKNIDDETGKKFKAAVALDGRTLTEVMAELMQGYSEKRFAELQKESKKK